jgi:hypothetical protein
VRKYSPTLSKLFRKGSFSRQSYRKRHRSYFWETPSQDTWQEREMGAGICEGVADVVMCVCGGSLSPKTSAAMLSELFFDSMRAAFVCVEARKRTRERCRAPTRLGSTHSVCLIFHLCRHWMCHRVCPALMQFNRGGNRTAAL